MNGRNGGIADMKINGYEDVLNEVYPKPPADTSDIVERIIENYPTEVFNIDDVAYLLLVKINDIDKIDF